MQNNCQGKTQFVYNRCCIVSIVRGFKIVVTKMKMNTYRNILKIIPKTGRLMISYKKINTILISPQMQLQIHNPMLASVLYLHFQEQVLSFW